MMRFFVVLGLVIALACSPCAADKVTADPNAGRSTPAAAAPAVDTLLTGKISYDGGYTRLHDVCQDVRKSTGIRLNCGQNSSDWRVRDVPLAIYAKDAPAGEFLKAVAASAHTQFTRLKVGDEDEKQPSYTITRTKAGQEAITAPLAARLRASRDRAIWAWDALVTAAGLPQPDSSYPAYLKTSFQDAQLIGSFLASLGPSARDRVLDGSVLKISVSSNAAAAKLYAGVWKKWLAQNKSKTPPLPDTASAYVKLIYVEDRDRAFGQLNMSVTPFPQYEPDPKELYTTGWRLTDFQVRSWRASIYSLASSLASAKLQGIPPEPKSTATRPPEDATPSPSFKLLRTDEDWDIPELKTKANLSLPKDKRDIVFADILCQAVRSAGLNLACEDFWSHKEPILLRMRPDFDEKATVADVLRAAPEYQWFFDRDARILVGWCAYWIDHHSRLVPEQMLANARSAINGRGAELDDMIPLMLLPQEQYEEWVADSREFSHIELQMNTTDWYRSLWKLYSTLDAKQRQMARSELGLPLAAVPADTLGGFAADLERIYEEQSPIPLCEGSETAVTFQKALADLGSGTDAVLKVSAKPAKMVRVRVMPTANMRSVMQVPAPEGPPRHTYSILLQGGRGDRSFTLGPSEPLLTNFPMLAADRKLVGEVSKRHPTVNGIPGGAPNKPE